MIVMKFGGVSVDGAERMLAVADIVATYIGKKPVVVVSAMKGVTDLLVNASRCFENGERDKYIEILNTIGKKHFDVGNDLNMTVAEKENLSHKLSNILSSLKEYNPQNKNFDASTHDFIISAGEKLCVPLLSAAFSKKKIDNECVDSGEVIVTTKDFGNAKPILELTKTNAIKKIFPIVKKSIVPIVTGFYGKTQDGHIATLGRGGSDFTASILANVSGAKEMIVWKEVNGVYTEDPKKNLAAQFLAELTYEKAAQMARAGAKILHPETMEPVKTKNIPIRVKNVFNPLFVGSVIS